jgi:hypothetical protein
MYHIKHKESVLTLVRSATVIKTKINSVFFDDIENYKPTKNIFDKFEIKKNCQLMNYSN